MKSIFEMKRFLKSDQKDFIEALNIYSNNIEPNLRTDTREIIYWTDMYAKIFDDKFLTFGLFHNKRIIGFAQLAYFINEKIIFFDYLVIDKEYRKHNTFYQFIEDLREYLNIENMSFDYILAEVGAFQEDMQPSLSARNIIRLLKFIGFKVIKSNYYHPRLGILNYESELKSVLMMYTSADLKSIKKETFNLFIDTIYFKHYVRWYDAFLSEPEKQNYRNGVINLKTKLNKELTEKKTVEINGYHNAVESSTKNINTDIQPSKVAKIIASIVLLILFSIIFGIIHLYLKYKLGIDTTAQTYILIVSSIAVIFVISLLLEGRTKPISIIIQKIIGKLLD